MMIVFVIYFVVLLSYKYVYLEMEKIIIFVIWLKLEEIKIFFGM